MRGSWLIGALALGALALSGWVLGRQQAEPSGTAGESRAARVVRVLDGDTLVASIGGRQRTIRLAGIDAPETVRPGVAIECGGPEASASLTKLAPAGARLSLIMDSSQDRRDRYGRLLRYVEVNGRDLGRALVAAVYVFERPFGALSEYESAAADAERRGHGVWELCGGAFHSAE